MKTFASAVAEVKDDLDDLGRDEALRFAASMSAHVKSRETPSTYQVACPAQFAKILAAAGLDPNGKDFQMSAKDGHPGLVTWSPTVKTSAFLGSVRPAPTFESLVLGAADDPADATPTSIYSGHPALSPEEITKRLSVLARSDDLSFAAKKAATDGIVGGHRVVLPPVWLLERLAIANGLQDRTISPPHTLFDPIDIHLSSLIEVPLVRHAHDGEKLYGPGLLVGAPPVDMYFSQPPETSGGSNQDVDRSNPLQGYFYQDAEFANEVVRPSKMVVASSALLATSGVNGVSVASFLSYGPNRLAMYIAAVLAHSTGLNAEVVKISVRSRLGNLRAEFQENFPSSPAAGPVIRSLGKDDVIVNFVAVLRPPAEYDNPMNLAAFVDVGVATPLQPEVLVKFTEYEPPVSPYRGDSQTDEDRVISRKYFGSFWRYAIAKCKNAGGSTYREFEEWAKRNPQATIYAAPNLMRSKFLLLTMCSQLRSFWYKSCKPLLVGPGDARVVVRGAYPAMLTISDSDLELKLADGQLLGQLVLSGKLDDPENPSDETWAALAEVPGGDLNPAVIFTTNIPAAAVDQNNRLELCETISAQAFTSFFNRSEELGREPSDFTSRDAASLFADHSVVEWALADGDASARHVRTDVYVDGHGRLVIAVVFTKSAGRMALMLAARDIGIVEEVFNAATKPESCGPVTIPASGPHDHEAISQCLSALVSGQIIAPVVDADSVRSKYSGHPLGTSLIRSDYLYRGRLVL